MGEAQRVNRNGAARRLRALSWGRDRGETLSDGTGRRPESRASSGSPAGHLDVARALL